MTDSFVAEPGRLDTVLAERLGVARAEAQRAIAGGLVHVDGQSRPKSFCLSGGERVDLEVAAHPDLEPDSEPLRVIFEDPHLIVVSKPAGILTHPTPSRRTGTLVNRLLGRGVPVSAGSDPDRPGIVHRLDVGTSGAMIVAKDDDTHAALAELFRRHEVERTYLALVRGQVPNERFLIDAPLSRDRARIRVRSATGRDAATEVNVRERLRRSTLIEARPRTGRTHQIRVHLASVGHPILGDRPYGGGGGEAKALGLDRPFLHSWKIAFRHPITGQHIEVDDPLPADLHNALARAREE